MSIVTILNSTVTPKPFISYLLLPPSEPLPINTFLNIAQPWYQTLTPNITFKLQFRGNLTCIVGIDCSTGVHQYVYGFTPIHGNKISYDRGNDIIWSIWESMYSPKYYIKEESDCDDILAHQTHHDIEQVESD